MKTFWYWIISDDGNQSTGSVNTPRRHQGLHLFALAISFCAPVVCRVGTVRSSLQAAPSKGGTTSCSTSALTLPTQRIWALPRSAPRMFLEGSQVPFTMDSGARPQTFLQTALSIILGPSITLPSA
jgi:hypothetical protein